MASMLVRQHSQSPMYRILGLMLESLEGCPLSAHWGFLFCLWLVWCDCTWHHPKILCTESWALCENPLESAHGQITGTLCSAWKFWNIFILLDWLSAHVIRSYYGRHAGQTAFPKSYAQNLGPYIKILWRVTSGRSLELFVLPGNFETFSYFWIDFLHM